MIKSALANLPSTQILQLEVANALELVHLAHQAGLVTYMSAGFKLGQGHIDGAVYSGIDGIGIGGAQVLRYMDAKTGHQGPCELRFRACRIVGTSLQCLGLTRHWQTRKNSSTRLTASGMRRRTAFVVVVSFCSAVSM